MVIGEYIGIAIGFCGCIVAVWRTASSSKSKVSYNSFDRYKKEIKEDYVENKMCVKEHGHVKETLDRLEAGMNKLLDKNGIKG